MQRAWHNNQGLHCALMAGSQCSKGWPVGTLFIIVVITIITQLGAARPKARFCIQTCVLDAASD